MLRVENLEAGYGHTKILRRISLDVNQAEIVSLIGANGAGKTTLMMTLSGIVKPTHGTIDFLGTKIEKASSHTIANLGLIQVPQGKLLFREMTVQENLMIGSYLIKDKKTIQESLEQVYDLFKILRSRSNQRAGTLSGGEQQMLAVGRALMAKPKLLLLDEPSSGLAPVIVEELCQMILNLRETGLTIFIVEQNAHLALDLADRGYVLQSGSIVSSGKASELMENDIVKEAYLGA